MIKCIAISGKIGSGKSTIARELFNNEPFNNKYKIKSIASNLKQICNILYNTNDKTKILQIVGNHMKLLDDDIWIKSLNINSEDNIIIDDLRYIDEVDYLTKIYGKNQMYLIRLEGNPNNTITSRDRNDKSEVDLDNYKHFDIKFNTDEMSINEIINTIKKNVS